jgi:L-ascorbate metabolism protein UlaG (beta-lactamase superfamily)
MAQRRAIARWCGAGIVELATPDFRDMVYVDTWFWSNRGWDAFGIEKPVEYTSPEGLAAYVKGKNPESVLVALTHDHNDHIGDYFATLTALAGAALNVKTVAQADMARAGLVQQYRDAGLDPTEIVVNGGGGANIGGHAAFGGINVWVVPAVHSTFLGFPAIGYIVEIGGVRFYASGDTDVYGDLQLVGRRYHPDVALVCAGGGAFTMGPDGAALAVELLGCSAAIPIHYAHNIPRGLGVEAGQQFKELVGAATPRVQVHTLVPGQSVELALD